MAVAFLQVIRSLSSKKTHGAEQGKWEGKYMHGWEGVGGYGGRTGWGRHMGAKEEEY